MDAWDRFRERMWLPSTCQFLRPPVYIILSMPSAECWARWELPSKTQPLDPSTPAPWLSFCSSPQIMIRISGVGFSCSFLGNLTCREAPRAPTAAFTHSSSTCTQIQRTHACPLSEMAKIYRILKFFCFSF